MLLNPSSILNVPVQNYEDDFVFIVNGNEFRTSRIVSDLLSPVICQIHSSDVNASSFIINTRHQGNFMHILNLASFNQVEISDNEVPFISEVIQILGNNCITHKFSNQEEEISVDNVFELIANDQKYSIFCADRLERDIDFISVHFYELYESHQADFLNLPLDTLLNIVSNSKIRLDTEDQLLEFVNNLYASDHKYSVLYESVFFAFASMEAIRAFLAVFDVNDMTASTWIRLSKRLEQDTKKLALDDEQYDDDRYIRKIGRMKRMSFEPSGQNEFNGIINFLKSNSNGLNVTAKSVYFDHNPINAISYENKDSIYHSLESEVNWICFDFKENRVIPTKYTLKGDPLGPKNSQHPKNWVIEGSCNCDSWEILDVQQECEYINGPGNTHTFTISKKSSGMFRYIRMRLTGPSWSGNNYLRIGKFEIYGKLIQNE